jgi:hypothetical protein
MLIALLLLACVEPEPATCPDSERVDALEAENAAQWETWQQTDAELRAWLAAMQCQIAPCEGG